MDPKISQFINKGMQQDYSISKASNEFAFKNHNIRITTRGENSLLTVTNEKSNKQIVFNTEYNFKVYKQDGLCKELIFDTPLFLNEVKILYKHVVLGTEEASYTFNEYSNSFVIGDEVEDIYTIELIIKGKYYNCIKTDYNTTYDYYDVDNVLLGYTLGTCISNDYVVLFQKHETNDYIELLQLNDNNEYILKTLYSGNLGFSLDHPIETLYNYESENVIKVYWVDGKNQPRVINIKGDIKDNNNSQFDFNPTVNSDLRVSITKQNAGGGTFVPGVIQYIITYYNNYGQESSPIYTSPLYYLSNSERGSNVEDSVSCMFTIKCEFLDSSWDNIVLYSLHRSSLDSTVLGYKVGEFNIKDVNEDSTITFIDNGTHLETIDATRFFFEADNFIPTTLASKGNKLFFGNITSVDSNDLTFALKGDNKVNIEFSSRDVEYPNYGGLYDYKFQLNEDESKIKTFKGGETYRVALQLQDSKGLWSSPIYLDDVINDKYPNVVGNTVKLPYLRVSIPYENLAKSIPNFKDYTKIRLLMAESTLADRSVLAQGILSPTIYNLNEAVNNTCNNANSWIQRFTLIDKHLMNVNSSALGESFVGTPSLLEIPVEKKDGKFDVINYDVVDGSEDEPGSANSKKANLKRIVYTLEKKGYVNKGIQLELYLKECIFDIYDTSGNLSETKSIDLTSVIGSNEDYYHFVNAVKPNKNFIAGGIVWRSLKSKLKKDTEILFNCIKAYLVSAKFVDNHKINNTTKSLYDIIRDKLGNIEIINVKKDNSILDVSSYENLDFESLYSEISDAIFDKKQTYSETTEIKNNFETIPTSKIQLARTESKNQYFVDANVVSFYSPDLENITADKVKFRIVGCAKLRHNISDYQVTVDSPNGRTMLLDFNKSVRKGRYLRSQFLYHLTDIYTKHPDEEDSNKGQGVALLSLWQKSGALSNNDKENILKRKVIGNVWYCDTNYYSDEGNNRILWENGDVSFKKVLDPIVSFNSKIYKKDYENLLLPVNNFEHIVKYGVSSFESLEKLEKEGTSAATTFTDINYNGCLIKYSSENHSIIKLPKDIILPGFRPTITGMEVPTRLSTGELLIPKQDRRFLPYPLQYKVDSIPKKNSEIQRISISIDGGDNGNSFTIAKDCYCPVVFWTEDELVEYLNTIGKSDKKDAVLNILNNNNLIFQTNNEVDTIPTDFIKSLAYKADTNNKIISRIAIYTNDDITITSPTHYYAGFVLASKMLEPKEFESNYTHESVYLYNLTHFNIKEKLGLKSNSHTNNCKASMVDNLPMFKYNRVLQIVSEDSDTFKYEITDDFWNRTPSIWIGELYRDVPNAYGGKDDLSISNTKYIVCGESFDLEHTDTTQEVIIKGTIGDTYFQRWDCLRTYPTTEEDVNSIVDVTSTMLETHINLDGRTDNTRGRLDVTNIRPFNINNINKVYSQSNNFFTYHSVDKRLVNNKIENCYTWSLSKVNGELIDSWTKGLMVNVNNVDGSKGKITKLQLWKDYLLCFQETGIARIHYNDQTTISSLEGVPIEILNSQTVSGHNYLSEAVGCHNKWSIASTESGIYFVDSINKSINIFNGEIINLSYNKAFKDWGTNNLNDLVWSHNNLGGYRASFDFKNRDYYLTNDYTCLSFSEELQSFSSFYDYTELPIMFNFKDKFIGIQSNEDKSNLWEQFEGNDYCNFCGIQKDYSVEFNINPNPLNDKIFTSLEYRAYVDNTDDTFDKLEVFNEYQHGESNPNTCRHKYPNAEKKFRIWRLDVPRDSNSRKGLDRIRNPWMKLKLTKSTNTNNRMSFHDLLVKYYE